MFFPDLSVVNRPTYDACGGKERCYGMEPSVLKIE